MARNTSPYRRWTMLGLIDEIVSVAERIARTEEIIAQGGLYDEHAKKHLHTQKDQLVVEIERRGFVVKWNGYIPLIEDPNANNQ